MLLERGAAHVTAIDVGHGQIAPALAADPRVSLIEGLNARDLDGRRPARAVAGFPRLRCQLHFAEAGSAAGACISLRPALARILLVKPQFEAGRAAIGKGGLLRDPDDGARIAEELRGWLDAMPGWRALGVCPSPIEGGDGNREFLLAGVKDR